MSIVYDVALSPHARTHTQLITIEATCKIFSNVKLDKLNQVDPLPLGHFFRKQSAVQAFKLDQTLCV